MTGNELEKLARNIEQHAYRRGYVSAFTIAAYPVVQSEELTLHITRECDGLVYGNAEVETSDAFKACIDAFNRHVDYILYDIGLPFEVASLPNDRDGSSILLPYSDLHVWLASARYTLLALVKDLPDKNVLVIGLEKPSARLRNFHSSLTANLAPCCKNIWTHLADEETPEIEEIRAYYRDADIIVGAAIYESVIHKEHLEFCDRNPVIIDAGIGTVSADAASYARGKGWPVIRVDNRAAMAGMLFSAIQSNDLVTRVMGEGRVDGIPVVAGGIVGPPGTIVLDSIDNPSMVIGFADGTGRIRYKPANDEEAERLAKIRHAIGAENPDE
jgi:hypothetical protein